MWTGGEVGMNEAEQRDMVISALEATQNRIEVSWQYGQSYIREPDFHAVKNAVAMLKDMGFQMMTHEEARVLSWEEVKAYLTDDDPDKNPLWVQWATSSVKGGWVLPHTVEDLMWRYESIYQAHWVLWTQKPNDEQKEAVLWRK
jgi:hypothetical protein